MLRAGEDEVEVVEGFGGEGGFAVGEVELPLADEFVVEAERAGIGTLIPGDKEWPSALDDLGDRRPYVLWTRGTTSFLARPVDDRVTITGAGPPRWEAYSPLPRLTLADEVPAAPARARIITASEGGLFQVAGLRALRLFSPPARYAFWEGPI